jgi:hypothetical protein
MVSVTIDVVANGWMVFPAHLDKGYMINKGEVRVFNEWADLVNWMRENLKVPAREDNKVAD